MLKNSIDFGKYLQQLRKEKRLTLKKLGELSGLSPSYLSRVERGKRNTPNAPVLKKIAPHLGLSDQEILIAAGYLNDNPGSEANRMVKGETPSHWQEIIKDPALDKALEEIGSLTSEEKEGLLTFLKAIKLRRELRKS